MQTLVKLRIVLEKIGPLEGKLKYQIEKLVRKADQADEGVDEDDVANGASTSPFSLRTVVLTGFSPSLFTYQFFF